MTHQEIVDRRLEIFSKFKEEVVRSTFIYTGPSKERDDVLAELQEQCDHEAEQYIPLKDGMACPYCHKIIAPHGTI